MNRNWSFTENDERMVSELSGIIPSEVFDAHAHIYRKEDLNIFGESFWNEGPEIVDIAVWEREMKNYFPGKDIKGGLFLSTPAPDCDIKKMNAFLIEELTTHPDSRGPPSVFHGF